LMPSSGRCWPPCLQTVTGQRQAATGCHGGWIGRRQTVAPGSWRANLAGMAGATAGAPPTPQGTRKLGGPSCGGRWMNRCATAVAPTCETGAACRVPASGPGGRSQAPAAQLQALQPQADAQHRIRNVFASAGAGSTTCRPCSNEAPPPPAPGLAPGWAGRRGPVSNAAIPSRCGQRPGRQGGSGMTLSGGQCR